MATSETNPSLALLVAQAPVLVLPHVLLLAQAPTQAQIVNIDFLCCGGSLALHPVGVF